MKNNLLRFFSPILFLIIIASLTACGSGTSPDDNYSTGDLCVNDFNKTEPGICGCGVADTDFDSDGVTDCLESRFVAVGDNGTVISSNDGISWFSRGSSSADLYDVATGSWVAVGEDAGGTGVVEKYTDEFSLTNGSLDDRVFKSVASDNAGNWAATSVDNFTLSSIISLSDDGIAWTDVYNAADPTNEQEVFRDIAYGNGIWVAVGFFLDLGTFDGESCLVVDSLSGWTAMPIQSDCVLNAVAYNGGTDWVAVGEDTTSFPPVNGYIFTYDDTPGVPVPVSVSGAVLTGVASDGAGNWIAVGYDGADGAIIKTGDTDPTVLTGVGPLNDIVYNNGRWIAVGDSGEVIYSDNDGASWNTASSGTSENLNGIALNQVFSR